MVAMKYERINVVGTSGSGKSTLAQDMARRLNLPYIELDRLFWKANWTESTDDEYFPKLRDA
ncbi:MAG: AAA family ATPase, partial [Pseudomonadota bacterium]|nr:AAA family ATPase [Pseudomonadota bacterium]